MTTPTQFQADVDKAVTNMGRLDQFVNGLSTSTVLTDTATIPTLAKFISDQATLIQTGLSASTVASIAGLQTALDNKERKFTVSVKDCGALGDGAASSAVDTAAFAEAVAIVAANPKGGRVFVPNGDYHISEGILLDRSGDPTKGRVSFVGQDENGTVISYTASSGSFLTVKNSHASGEQNTSFQSFENMTILGIGGGGTGITVDLGAFMTYRNLIIAGFQYGIYGQDIDHSMFDRVKLRWNVHGALFRKNPTPGDASTQPNNLLFQSCAISNNSQTGATFSGGAGITFLSGNVESNGSAISDGYGLKFFEAGYEGAMGANLVGVYFESNKGIADVVIENVSSAIPNAVTHNVMGCGFTRASAALYATNNILTIFGEASTYGLQVLNVTGCGFKSAGGYTPNSGRKYIAFGGVPANKHNFNQSGNLFEDAIETPANMQSPNKMYVEGSKLANQDFTSGTASTWLLDFVSGSYSWTPTFSSGSFTILETGVYSMSVFLSLTSSPSGSKQVLFKVNDNVVGFGESSSTASFVSAQMTKLLTVGDTVRIEFLQNSGSTVTVAGASGSYSHFNITKHIDG